MDLAGEEHGSDWVTAHVELIVNKVLTAHMCTAVEGEEEVEMARYFV